MSKKEELRLIAELTRIASRYSNDTITAVAKKLEGLDLYPEISAAGRSLREVRRRLDSRPTRGAVRPHSGKAKPDPFAVLAAHSDPRFHSLADLLERLLRGGRPSLKVMTETLAAAGVDLGVRPKSRRLLLAAVADHAAQLPYSEAEGMLRALALSDREPGTLTGWAEVIVKDVD